MDNKKKIIVAVVIAIIIIAIAITVFLLTKNTKTLHTISFSINDGEYVFSQEIEDGKTVNKPSEPNKEGYEFLGWYLNDKEFDFSTPIKGNITLEAKWEKITENNTDTDVDTNKDNDKDKKEDNKQNDNSVSVTKYTVTFNSNGGTSVEKQSIEKNKTAKTPSNPTKSGYKFLGWYLGDSKFDFSTKITKNITLTAKWEKEQVVSYKVEEVSGSVIQQVKIFVTVDGVKTAGTVDITYTSGKKATVSVPTTGYMEVKGTYTSISNPKVK